MKPRAYMAGGNAKGSDDVNGNRRWAFRILGFSYLEAPPPTPLFKFEALEFRIS